MARSVLYVGDQQPSLPTVVTDMNGNAVNLTGYTGVQFAMRQAYDSANKWKSTAVVVAPTTGSIRYDLGATDLASLTPGVYIGQWILTDVTGKSEHAAAGEFEVRKGF
jgi:hypothetical protein